MKLGIVGKAINAIRAKFRGKVAAPAEKAPEMFRISFPERTKKKKKTTRAHRATGMCKFPVRWQKRILVG
jgi:hypothetical protein